MAKWIEYTGSNEQVYEINNAKHGYTHRKNKLGKSEFIINDPHPCAGLIKIWADTGCEVHVRVTKIGDKNEFPELVQYIESVEHIETYCTNEPDWNIPGAEYSLTPFED